MDTVQSPKIENKTYISRGIKFDEQKFNELIKEKEYENSFQKIKESDILYSKSFLKSLENDEDYLSRFQINSDSTFHYEKDTFLKIGFFHPNNIFEKCIDFYYDDNVYEKIIKILSDYLNIIEIKNEEVRQDKEYSFRGLLNGCIISLFSINNTYCHVTFCFYYHKKQKELYEKLFELFEKCIVKTIIDESLIYLLKIDLYGNLVLNKFTFKNKNTDLNLNYNDDFKNIDKKCKEIVNNNEHGLILFNSTPGNGKSSYLYYLSNYFKDKRKVIYIPSNMLHLMDDSKFHDLLSQNEQSIIIMEDCENIILSREINKNGVVQTLLNYTDGFLAEIFKPIFICTFNTDISKIDKALLRKGRCLLKYEFKALQKEKAQKLSDSLGFNSIIQEDMSLADVYNQDSESYSIKEKNKIGF